MSGVVSPVVTCSSDVVTPSVPMLAEGCPRHPPELPGQLDRRGLAVGAGDRDHVSGKGGKNFAASRANSRLGSAIGDMDRALDLGFGPRRPPPPRRGDRGGNEVLAVEALAPEGAEDRAGRDLAVVDREAGDACGLAAAGQRAEVHQCSAWTLSAGHNPGRVDVAAGFGDHAEQGADALMMRPATGAEVIAAVVDAAVGGVGAGRIHHDQHHIARRVHRESRSEAGHVGPTIIAARPPAFRRCRSCRRPESRRRRRCGRCRGGRSRRSSWRIAKLDCSLNTRCPGTGAPGARWSRVAGW